MTNKQIGQLFLATFVAILIIYSIFLGNVKTILLLLDATTYILIALGLSFVLWYYKRKLKTVEILDFNKNSNLTFQSTTLFFLFFQVIDYIYEGGFIGMISQWFFYWIMGIIAFIVITIINYYKNIQYYKQVLTHDPKYYPYES
ncbi:MAG: hypothetical protein K8R39_06205 [Arcobacteraceae bacterium]|nr:hypothetical protein [Arcobacteraceae bacterium]